MGKTHWNLREGDPVQIVATGECGIVQGFDLVNRKVLVVDGCGIGHANWYDPYLDVALDFRQPQPAETP